MNIRAAAEGDIDALAALNSDVQGLHVTLFPDRFKETDPDEVAGWFQSVLEKPCFRTLIALADEAPVGYIVLRIKDRPEHAFCKARKLLYVDQISVRHDYRNKGVGRALLEAAKAVALAEGLQRLELDVWSENTEAKRFFAAQGYVTSQEIMKLEL